MLTDGEKKAREGALGSSDAAIVAGISKDKTTLTLYHQLRGDLPRYDDEESEAQKWGSRMQPIIAEVLAEDHGIKYRRCPLRVHKKYSFIVAHLDYEIISDPRGPGCYEIKQRDKHDEPNWEHGIPDGIALQCVHQMATTNRDYTKIGALFGGNRGRVFTIERDKELEEYLIEIEVRFMERVAAGTPPEITGDETATLKKLYPADSGRVITLEGPKVLAMLDVFRDAKLGLKAEESRKLAAESWLKNEIKDAAVAKIPGFGSITWKTTKSSPVEDIDLAKLKAEFPEAYAACFCVKTKPGHRVFLTKPGKEVAT
jgi:predicted phage-related endonuclease